MLGSSTHLPPYVEERVIFGRETLVKVDSYDGQSSHIDETGCQMNGDTSTWFRNVFNRESYKKGFPAYTCDEVEEDKEDK